MPEISVLPAVPATPVVAGAAAPAQAGARDAAATSGEPGIASFLSQLQSALGSLGLLPQATPTAASTPAQQPDVLGLPVDEADDSAKTDDVMPEMLAALGFVPVPMVLTAATPTTETAPAAAASTSSVPTGPVAQQLPQQAQPAADGTSAEVAPAAGQLTETAQPATADVANVPAQPHQAAHTPAPQIELPKEVQLPNADTVAAAQAQTQTLQPRAEQPSDQQPRAAHRAASPIVDAPVAQTLITQPLAGQPAQQGSTSSDSDDPSADTAPVNGTDATQGRTDAPVPAFSVASTERVSATPDQVRPAHVVGQIAHQSELYRLPGGRGVRIQLNPDDLGGVGVTIKYGATGGLELHVTAEHAATAELVQAGWNDLRDALSLQGIAPERLIMSVSGPGDASFSDAGNGNSGFRSDAGQASFGQANQQQQEREGARASRGFSGFVDNTTPDEARPAATASSSRIDYRA